tara:strand:- start:128 stop:292 length:165 start_codon:yes stop_codon:yes gene_type:complete
MYPELNNKRILITGASGDIGGSIARHFAESGAVLGIHYSAKGKWLLSLSEQNKK